MPPPCLRRRCLRLRRGLVGIPGVGVVTASGYGAAIGDLNRYRDAAGAYRASGLVPISHGSAGGAVPVPASAQGPVELPRAIVDWAAASACTTDFIAYRREPLARGSRRWWL